MHSFLLFSKKNNHGEENWQKTLFLQSNFLCLIEIVTPKCNHIGQIKEKELSREEIAGVCQVFAASSFGFQFFYEITETKKPPTNTSPKTVSIPTLTFDTIPIKIVLMKIATEI